MTLLGFIILLIIAAIAGSLGQALAGYSLGGCLVSSVVGFIGAFVGLWLVACIVRMVRKKSVMRRNRGEV